MKSTLISVMWPTWEWTRSPESRWLFASYAGSLSIKHSIDRRQIIESGWYQERWGDAVQLSHDQNLKSEFVNTARGHMIATSVGGSATGKGGTRIVIDDPHNPRQALSDVQRAEAIRFFDQTTSTRLDDKTRGAIVVVMQRLHEGDLTKRCLDLGYTHVKFEALCESSRTYILPSGRTIQREAGNVLWPARETRAQVEGMKQALGAYGFAGQYQQRPAPAGGGMFKREWFRTIEALPAMGRTATVRAWDCAGTADGGDWTVGVKMSRYNTGLFVIEHVVRGRFSSATVNTLIQQTATADGRIVRVREEQEPGSSGKAVVQARATMLAGWDYKGIPSTGEKTTRWRPFAVQCEVGNVALLAGPWNEPFLDELALVPYAEHDDQADAAATAFNDLTLGNAGGGVVRLQGI
jgi:predicted phage terminase large subunit-like protein